MTRWILRVAAIVVVVALVATAATLVDGPGRSTNLNADGDRDGIPDRVELAGWLTQGNSTYTTDPDSADTDGDGLSDGDEAGRFDRLPLGGGAYEGLSHPRSSDFDGDGLDDASERDAGLSPWAADSDEDDLPDFVEIEFGSDPLTVNADGDHLGDSEEFSEGSDPNYYDLTDQEAWAAFGGGVIPSEWAARRVGLSDEQMESVPYLAGSVARTAVPLSELRKLGTSLMTRSWRSSLLALAGLIPGLGTALKVMETAYEFASKGGRATQAAMRLFASVPGLGADERAAGIRQLVRLDPSKARLSFDASVRGTSAPEALSVDRPVSLSDSINVVKEELVIELTVDGFTDIRINQQQVDSTGDLVGINRPDVQATAPDGTRHYYVIEESPDPGPRHLIRLLSNDDDGEVHTVIGD